MTVILKIHEAYRKIVSVCDKDLLGKKLIEGNRQIDVDKIFYSGEEMDDKKALQIMKAEYYDDSTFSIVGKDSIALGIKVGIVSDKKEAVFKVQGVPYALGLI